MNSNDFKTPALAIMRAMGIIRGKIEIDVNTAFNSARVKITRYRTRTDGEDEIFISETHSL